MAGSPIVSMHNPTGFREWSLVMGRGGGYTTEGGGGGQVKFYTYKKGEGEVLAILRGGGVTCFGVVLTLVPEVLIILGGGGAQTVSTLLK